MIFKFICVALIFAVASSEEQKIEMIGNYHFAQANTQWYDARIFCTNNNLKLASIETPEEAALIQSLAPTGGLYWTSGTDVNQPHGSFFWATGGAIEHSNGLWLAGEPNDYLTTGTEVTVAFDTNTGKISDHPFWDGYKFICEV